MVAARPGSPLVDGLAAVITSGGGIAEVAAVLNTAGGSGLAPFACVIEEPDSVRVLIRGDIWANLLQGSPEEVEVRGPGGSTWSEQVFAGVSKVVLGLEGARFSGAAFHVGTGVVPAGIVERRCGVLAVAPPQSPPERGGGEAPVDAPPAADPLHYPHLVEDTRFRGVEVAAVRESEAEAEVEGVLEPSMPAAEPPELRHDTIVFEPEDGDPMALSTPAGGVTGEESGRAPDVQAVLCSAGHPNPPHSPVCRACGIALADLACGRW